MSQVRELNEVRELSPGVAVLLSVWAELGMLASLPIPAPRLLSLQALRTGPAAPPGLHPDPASRREHGGPTQRPELTGLHGTALPHRGFSFLNKTNPTRFLFYNFTSELTTRGRLFKFPREGDHQAAHRTMLLRNRTKCHPF